MRFRQGRRGESLKMNKTGLRVANQLCTKAETKQKWAAFILVTNESYHTDITKYGILFLPANQSFYTIGC